MKMKFLGLIAISLLALAACKPASAADWNYVGGAYTMTNLHDRSGDGYKADGSFALGKHVIVQGGYANGFDRDVRAGSANLGVGLHTALAQHTDGYALFRATAVVRDRRDYNNWGYEAEAGVRQQVSDRLELRAGVVADNFRQANSFRDVNFAGKVGAEYALTKNFRLTADMLASSKTSQGQVGFRVYF